MAFGEVDLVLIPTVVMSLLFWIPVARDDEPSPLNVSLGVLSGTGWAIVGVLTMSRFSEGWQYAMFFMALSFACFLFTFMGILSMLREVA
ncbi:MAG: hypothetical protein DRO12_03720 [Thermoprotei archaeon]|nr:MAG: hypothetical protein DRO12_03720 [Thermoprotei archaeon]